MAFIGTPLDTRNTFQSLVGKRFSGNGSTTDFTLDIAPSSPLDIEVFVGNVRQDPNSAYTVSGTTLSFTGAPPSGTNNIYVVHQAKSVGTIDVPALGVSTASIQADAIDGTKIADDSISDEHLDITAITGQTAITSLADTDKFLVSDASDSGNLKYVEKQYLPSGTHVKLLSGSASSSVNHDFQNFMDTSKYRRYLVLLTDIVSAGSDERFNLQFIANTTVSSGNNYWGSVLGRRSGGTNYELAYEQESVLKMGIHLVMNSGNAGNYLFHIINSPNQQDMSNNVFGANWGYVGSYGDYAFTNFAGALNTSDNITGFRLTESGSNATTFDYEIYGILK